MLARCYNTNHKSYADYGGRGITVCERWRNDFWAFVEDVGHPPSKCFALDRKNSNGPYSPDNCRWISVSNNNRNRRRHGHETRQRNEKGQFV